MSKHTPGPWKVLQSELTKSAAAVGPNRSDRVAFVVARRREGERDANAWLIASSPRLLHQLRILDAAISAHLDPEDCAHGRIDWADLQRSTREAIAEAEGQE